MPGAETIAGRACAPAGTLSPDGRATGRLAALIREAGSVVALTGAGISVPSGIPDFRSPGTGLWERVDPTEVAHIDAFRADPARFWGFYGERFASLTEKRPNGAHAALAELERRGLLDGVITQNVDMLHRRAGTRELVEVHGSIATSSCLGCGEAIALEQARARIASEPDGVPRCEACREPLKPDVVLFGELLPQAAFARARELCEGADLLLCIGSSLEVHPVAGLPTLTRERGGAVAILTQGPTPLDEIACVRLRGDVVEELEALLAALGSRG
ncbi:MAG TPA: Sir2 family NAD-dependent protein deacetylase [Solirubrobacteraceae bacterium]|nr:Sir2 family NAD-dependent protein deacetylase [Solirubrobacteraceae bacterium]